MYKFTRISYNSAEWQRPTGDARKYEVAGTYNQKHGFGHEDWLFRSEWLIDGWRYTFLQGVNKSHAKLAKEGQPVDITLFTIQPDKQRRYVATIYAVECLDDQQAKDALDAFKQRGWHDTMRKEIQAVSGDESAFGAAKWAKHLLNVRFRQENVRCFAPGTYAQPGDPIIHLNRYQLYDSTSLVASIGQPQIVGRSGSSSLPIAQPYLRNGTHRVECTPEHARMQAQLMKELRSEYPNTSVVREEGFVDVTVRTPHELILFEIKSDLEPRTVVRHAMGQILEYAYHPSRRHTLPVRLVIVGRCQLSTPDRNYMNRLKQDFRLPIEYRVVPI
jgi:hypothetical protein